MNKRVLDVLEYKKILSYLADFAVSNIAKHKALNLQPSTDVDEIIYLQQQTNEGVSAILRKGNPPLGQLKNIKETLKRVEIGGVLNPSQLLEVQNLLRVSRKMKSFMKDNRKTESYDNLEGLTNDLEIFKDIENDINASIANEEEILDTASQELSRIRRQMRNCNNKVKDILNNIIHSSSYQKYLQEPVVTMRADRYVVPVKSENKSNVKGIVHDSSSSGATLFIEPMAVVEANNELRELKLKEKNEIQKILTQLTQKIESCLEKIKNNMELIVQLDFIFAKAKYALSIDAIEPIINTNRYINIKKGRHPLLDSKTVVPTDIYMGKDFKVLIITGPNTGGKTVTLKTLGLFALMTQSGLHIPANYGTEMPVFQSIFADIGDEQSIEQSLSTFSSHMTNIVKILDSVNENSLVLVDELGAGTDPVEGAALAMSILKYLYKVGACVAATTHYSELKLFALSNNGIENACCEFDVETLKPTYKLLIGVPGKSNAFAISSRLGLKSEIIEKAREFISKENIEFEDIITDLEKDREQLRKEKEQAAVYRKEVENLKKQLEMEKEKYQSEKQKLLNESRKEARKIVQGAKKESEQIITKLKEIEKEKQEAERIKIIEEARTNLNNKINKLDDSITESIIPKQRYSKPPKNLKPGDLVFITTLNKNGRIITPPGSNGEAMLQIGIMKINVHISNLRKIDEDINTNVNKSSGIGKIAITKSSNISTEIDLRGLVLDDALIKVDKFLDDATLASLKEITLIHGKGTGVLRSGIHKMLRTHKHVKFFRLGRYGEGESGVTIVELK